MSKARMYGIKTPYISNTRVDLRYLKQMARKKERKPAKNSGSSCEHCLRWPECNGVDAENCPLRKETEKDG